MTALASPLTARQIEAADTIRGHLSGWIAIDQALADVAARFPGMDSASSLVKTAILDRLYGTNVWAVLPMAEHVAAVFLDADSLNIEPTALVERLAALPGRNRWSFAAKFCHFFVNPARFPIYDSYALGTVARHLGRRRHNDVNRPYHAFVLNLQELKAATGLTCSWAELDRYLYLAGQYESWKRNPNAQISKETARLFATPPPDVASGLLVLDGTAENRSPIS